VSRQFERRGAGTGRALVVELQVMEERLRRSRTG